VHPADSNMLTSKNKNHVCEVFFDFNSDDPLDVVYELLQTIAYFTVKMYI